jgi:hypothetical protein
MKSVGILQPGKLGDIIICLPIAKYYHDYGYKVIWPIFSTYVEMFKEVIDYVDFIPVTDDVYQCFFEAKQKLQALNVKNIFDIAATFPGSNCTDEYVRLGDGHGEEKFDQFKYRKCNVPFCLKWSLSYKSNLQKEDELFNLKTGSEPYDIFSTKHSRGNLNIKFESKNKLIEIDDKHNIFYWRKILENAKNIALVDSAMANLVEQLNIKSTKTLLLKPGHPRPVFKNNWRIIEV